MKRKLLALSQRYGAALDKHLRLCGKDGDGISSVSLKAAHSLGREAAALGLETLDMARVHEQAIIILDQDATRTSKLRGERNQRGNAFFAEAIHPIEETHLIAREARARLGRLNKRLRQQTVQLAARHRQLKHKIDNRKTAETVLKKSGANQENALDESLQLQQQLRILAHRLLETQEKERGRLSRGLRDEIAQTLLGINVRLLSLKGDASNNASGLQTEIARAQELVALSKTKMRRVVRGFHKNGFSKGRARRQ